MSSWFFHTAHKSITVYRLNWANQLKNHVINTKIECINTCSWETESTFVLDREKNTFDRTNDVLCAADWCVCVWVTKTVSQMNETQIDEEEEETTEITSIWYRRKNFAYSYSLYTAVCCVARAKVTKTLQPRQMGAKRIKCEMAGVPVIRIMMMMMDWWWRIWTWCNKISRCSCGNRSCTGKCKRSRQHKIDSKRENAPIYSRRTYNTPENCWLSKAV